MSARLEGRVAVITGGASGIGAATARRFVEEGARVVLGDLREDVGSSVAAELGDAAGFLRCDVVVEEQVAALVDRAHDLYGRLDVMVNSAGIVGARGPIVTTDADEFRATLEVHVMGTFHGTKHAARVMQPRGSGSIVNLASTAGVQGGLGPHAYAAAKHAIVGLTRNAAAELCRSGIRVNCIAPGSTATPMVAMAHLGDAGRIDEVTRRLAESSPIRGRPGLPVDVANAALFLAGDESGNVNGHTLAVDGGLTTGSSGHDPPYSSPQPFLGPPGSTAR